MIASSFKDCRNVEASPWKDLRGDRGRRRSDFLRIWDLCLEEVSSVPDLTPGGQRGGAEAFRVRRWLDRTKKLLNMDLRTPGHEPPDPDLMPTTRKEG